jgi:hypothetical protein
MYRIYAFILFLIYLNNVNAQEVNIPKDYNVKIKIPDSWIEKLRHFDYTRNDTVQLTEFESFIKPDTLANPHWQHVDEGYGRVFCSMSINLDGDTTNELLCLMGWDITSPYLTLFKYEHGNWYLIYLEEIDTFYSSPTLYVANCFSRNKTFYLKRVYDHGSGIYIDGYSFYKLVDNKVYKCLDLVNDAHIYGWGLYMNQAIRLNVEFSGDESDILYADYEYDFFPGAINTKDCSWCANEDIHLIKGEDNVSYNWNANHHSYELDIPKYKNNADDLTASKIACFGGFGNDTLFVRAFKGQIDEVLKEGMPQQKIILKRYLALVKKDKAARTEELEVTTQTGGTTFYGIKKKKKK